MWRPLDIKGYIIKKEKSDEECSIYISDFVRIWGKTLKNEDIVAIFKEMNPLIEAEFNMKLIEKVLSLFDGLKLINKKIEENGDQLMLQLESDLSGIKFYFKLELKQLEPEKLFHVITLPFMLLAANLKIRENKLIDIILRKDAEISEYKQENAVIKRSHLITKTFNLDEVLNEGLEESHSSMSEVRKNPSLILDIINAEVLQTQIYNFLRETDVCEETSSKNSENILSDFDSYQTRSKNAFNSKKSLLTNMKYRKAKNKVEVKINSGIKRKKENFPVQLKL